MRNLRGLLLDCLADTIARIRLLILRMLLLMLILSILILDAFLLLIVKDVNRIFRSINVSITFREKVKIRRKKINYHKFYNFIYLLLLELSLLGLFE